MRSDLLTALRNLRASALLLALAAAACGRSDMSGNPDLAPLSTEQACADRARAACARLDACRKNAVTLYYPDLQTCVARNTTLCIASQKAPGAATTPADSVACTTALAGAACADYLAGTLGPCQVHPGNAAAGARCAFHTQCQSGFCLIPAGAGCGTCGDRPAAGAPCDSDLQCAPGQVCAAGRCKALSGTNASCTTGNECDYGLACVGPLGRATCQRAVAMPGAACSTVTGPPCDFNAGLYCPPAAMGQSSTCGAYLYAQAGAPCGALMGQYTLCTGGAFCDIPPGATTGLCVAPAADGAPCDLRRGPSCLYPARCITGNGATAGICIPPDQLDCR